jgi:hypothetical protein
VSKLCVNFVRHSSDSSTNRQTDRVLSFRYHALQRRNPNAILKLPDTQNNIDVATNEPVVGGVYLRLFIASPAWALRKPKEFLSELMDTTLTLMSKEKTDVSIRSVTSIHIIDECNATREMMSGHVK